MFTSLGLFKEVLCPKKNECELTNCIFIHEVATEHGLAHNGAKIYDPFDDVVDSVPPPAKRRRLESPEQGFSYEVKSEQQTFIRVHEALKPQHASIREVPESSSFQSSENAVRQTLPLGNKPENIRLASAFKHSTKLVSPPPIRSAKKAEGTVGRLISPKASKEVLVPRQVARSPATYKARNSYLKLLYSAVQKLNQQIKKGDSKPEALRLSEDELIRFVVDEEMSFASTCGENIYQQTIGRRIKSLQKMALPDWITFVIEKFEKTFVAAQPVSISNNKSEDSTITTGLPSAHEEILILRRLRTSLKGLEGHGYVTEPVSDEQLESARKGNESAAGYEKCDRCGTRFRVFPGRDEEGRLTNGGECTHHWGKVFRPPRQKGGNILGRPDAYYSCCSKPMGTEGCTTNDTHVFKVTDPARLATVLQFERTPASDGKKKCKRPITFDCEMAYTTLGLELVRLTAVSWPQGKKALDVLVRPFGEILDLNTRFSGVSKEQWAKTIPYDQPDSEHGDDTSEGGEVERDALRKVNSPAVARQLLFDLLTPDTPLLGHAIDNDLNCCRIIHPFIVDTVLLFPHPQGLPIRFGLKVLAGRYLKRSIQQGGEQGHDSKEDAVATGDLVRFKVAEKWKDMKVNGWKFEDGVLLEPEEETGRKVDGDQSGLSVAFIEDWETVPEA